MSFKGYKHGVSRFPEQLGFRFPRGTRKRLEAATLQTGKALPQLVREAVEKLLQSLESIPCPENGET